MKRKKRRLVFGKIKGPDFKPVDVHCPHCHGSGEDPGWDDARRRRFLCLGCNGSGLRADFAARLLAGTIQLDEVGRPFELEQASKLRDYYGTWKFEMGDVPNEPKPNLDYK